MEKREDRILSFNRQRPVRRSPRLKGYDYSQTGVYFLTVCTYQREHLFGEVVNGVMQLNSYGAIVERCWDGLPGHYRHIALDYFVVMPNHVHGIVIITYEVGGGSNPPLRMTIGHWMGIPSPRLSER